MYLTKLEIHGFKSFADRTEILFDQGITGIVGPNGSGKSNISDAVRWVLGEQSAKSLRGAKMEDIIFNGSEKRKALAWCEVCLTLNNDDRALAVDYAEVSITRRVYRSGESEYLLNRNPCRLKDVVDLFRDSGVGKEGYSIIGQGRVDELLSTRAEDRIRIFQEAVGIGKYRARKDEAERRLQHAKQNMQRLSDLMAEMERQLEPLRQQSETARVYLSLEDELRGLEINRFLVMTGRYTQEEQRLSSLLLEMGSRGEDCERRIHGEETLLDELRLRAETLEAQWAKGQASLLDLSQRLQEQQTQARLFLERMEHHQADIRRLEDEIAKEGERASAMEEEAQNLEKEQGDKSVDEEAQKDRIAAQRSQVAAMEETIAAEDQRLEAMKNQVMDSLAQLSDVKSAMARFAGLEAGIRQRLEQIEEEQRQNQGEKAIADDFAGDVEKELAELESTRQACQSQKAKHTEERQAVWGKLVQLDRDIAAGRERLQAAKTRVQMLQSMKRDYEGYNATIKRLLTDTKRVPELARHVDHVLAEVLEVPKEYVTAVEMTLGGSLQDVIVEREENAKAVIEYLREHQYGRATFLPMNVIRGRSLTAQEEKVLSMSGCRGVASRLVRCAPQYRGIVDNFLGRTLVAEDMDAAIAISRASAQSLRVVTLEGDVLNPGGSISGGSARSKFTGILGRETELEEAQKGIAQTEASILVMNQDREVHQSAIQKIDNAIMEADDILHQAEVAAAQSRERLEKAAQSVERTEQLRLRLEAERDQLLENIADLQREMEEGEGRQGNLEAAGVVSRADIAELAGQVADLRNERDLLVETIGFAMSRMAAGEKEREGTAAHVKRLRAEGRRILGLAEERKTQIVALQGEIQRCQDTQAEASVAADGEDTQLQAVREELATLEQARQEARKASYEKENALRDIREDAAQLSAKVRQTEVQLSRMEAEREAMRQRMAEVYDLDEDTAQAHQTPGFALTGKEERRIDGLRGEIRAMGPVNLAAVEDYAALKARHSEFDQQHRDLTAAESDLLEMIGGLEEKMEARFRENFEKLNGHFTEIFTQLFGGGTARLVLQDEKDVLQSGIDIIAQPPGKRLQLLSLLSGGERALTAIAILFAILRLRPSPFCILDEIEAALDEANLHQFAKFLGEYAKKNQFVVVTHRKSTMEASDTLYGITMEEKGVSKVVSVHMTDYVSA